nr:helix-turn-helix transcriptional regulator [Treponema sp.]
MDIDINTEVQKVAERIQKLRQKRHMSQMDLALESGISQGFLAMVESNRKVPTITTIFKIAQALNIHPSTLLEDADINREEAKQKIIRMIEKEL